MRAVGLMLLFIPGSRSFETLDPKPKRLFKCCCRLVGLNVRAPKSWTQPALPYFRRPPQSLYMGSPQKMGFLLGPFLYCAGPKLRRTLCCAHTKKPVQDPFPPVDSSTSPPPGTIVVHTVISCRDDNSSASQARVFQIPCPPRTPLRMRRNFIPGM